MRRTLVLLHRWAGLFTAVFLFISGLTGAIISWDHELDEALNPDLFRARSGPEVPTMSGLLLADLLEWRDQRVRVSFVSLETEPGHTQVISVDPKVDPKTGKLYPLEYNQVAMDPGTQEVQGRRYWGVPSLSRENLLPFLYKLHYTMHIPDGFGLRIGMLFMGLVAIVWALDALIALWISFPNRKTWRKSFAFRLREGGYKLNFDLHRSGGVWAWGLLFVLAVTAISMNLNREIMRPLVATFSKLTPSPFETRAMQPEDEPIEPTLTRSEAIALARAAAPQHGITDPVGGVFYAERYGVYGVGFYRTGDVHGDGGLGNPWLYFDGKTGAPAGTLLPGRGSLGDIFLQSQFPIHSGRIFGVPGRVVISFLGLVVAMLSVTGIVIWAKKRRARLYQQQRNDDGRLSSEAAPVAASASASLRYEGAGRSSGRRITPAPPRCCSPRLIVFTI